VKRDGFKVPKEPQMMGIDKTITSVNNEVGVEFLETCPLYEARLKSACPLEFLQLGKIRSIPLKDSIFRKIPPKDCDLEK
jgi:hypothetical protein